MRLAPHLFLSALVATAVAWPIAATGSTPLPTRLLDARRADYLEDEHTGRRLADLDVRLHSEGNAARLELRVAAVGENVDPAPGYRGRHGANHITARDLTELVDTGRLRVVVLTSGTPAKRVGTVLPGQLGRIPERRLDPAGHLDLDAESAEAYLLDIAALSPDLGPGDHEVYLEVHGLPRLRVDVQIRRGSTGQLTGTISALACLGGHDLKMRPRR